MYIMKGQSTRSRNAEISWLIKTITNLSYFIGFRQPDLSSNSTE